MGLQHVGQANANQPYNGTPSKLQYNRMKNSEPQPATPFSLSLRSVQFVFMFQRCRSCRKIVLFRVTTQTNLEAAGGRSMFCSEADRLLPRSSRHSPAPALWLPHPPSQTYTETFGSLYSNVLNRLTEK